MTTESTAIPLARAAGTSRTCPECAKDKPLNEDFFEPLFKGTRFRKECRMCHTKFVRASEKETAEEARKLRDEGGLALHKLPNREQAAKDPVVAATRAAILEARASVTDVTRSLTEPKTLPKEQLTVIGGMRIAAARVNAMAPTVIACIEDYVNDRDHPRHAWALELVADRLLPQRLYTGLGLRDAGLRGEDGEELGVNRGPRIQINILPASPTAGGKVTDVKILSDESEEQE